MPIKLIQTTGASLQVYNDEKLDIQSIAVTTDQGLEWKTISPTLYELLLKELQAQPGAISNEV